MDYSQPKESDSKAEDACPEKNLLKRVKGRLSDVLTIVSYKRVWDLKVVGGIVAYVVMAVPEPV